MGVTSYQYGGYQTMGAQSAEMLERFITTIDQMDSLEQKITQTTEHVCEPDGCTISNRD